MMLVLIALALTFTGCVGLDPKNEGFGENAVEVARRTFMGVMTLGISEGVLSDERKKQRLEAAQEVQYRRWYDGLSDTEKNIEDMRAAHRYQLMGTIMQNRPVQNYQLSPSQPYRSAPNMYDGTMPARQRTNCSSTVIGTQVNTTCY